MEGSRGHRGGGRQNYGREIGEASWRGRGGIVEEEERIMVEKEGGRTEDGQFGRNVNFKNGGGRER